MDRAVRCIGITAWIKAFEELGTSGVRDVCNQQIVPAEVGGRVNVVAADKPPAAVFRSSSEHGISRVSDVNYLESRRSSDECIVALDDHIACSAITFDR